MAEGYSLRESYSLGSLDISGANTVQVVFPRHFKLLEIRFSCGTVTASAEETMTCYRRVIPGSATSQVTIGTFPVATGYAAGDEVRIPLYGVADTTFNSGEQFYMVCGNSTGTGTIYVSLLGYHYDDGPTPQHGSFTAASKSVSAGVGSHKYVAFTAS